jgi:enoyl-CoA hydratase
MSAEGTTENGTTAEATTGAAPTGDGGAGEPAALVHWRSEGGVATLTLDGPRRNALSGALVAQLLHALRRAADDPEVRIVVLSHTGTTFCAGADLTEAVTGPEQNPRRIASLLRALLALPKPVVARIDGHVRAGGLGIVGACDLAVAGPQATFAFSEVRLGLAPTVISLALLRRLDPRGAARWYLTGAPFGSLEAQRIGLVTEAADDSGPAVAALVDLLLPASPQGLRETKALLNAGELREFDRWAEAAVADSARLFGSVEGREGMAAFLERRPPSWTAALPQPPHPASGTALAPEAASTPDRGKEHE